MVDVTCEIGSIPMPNVTWLFEAVSSFAGGYGSIHPYLAMGLCIAGTLMNIITVIVLTRPQMQSPVNILLCAVALCDIIVMGTYFVFVVHFLLAADHRCDYRDYSYPWAIFMMFHAHASVIFHSTSIWLTVLLAQIRVLTIRRATTGPTTSINIKMTVIISILTCLAMAAVNLPNFLTFEIVEYPAEAYLTCLHPAVEDEILDDQIIQETLAPSILPTLASLTTFSPRTEPTIEPDYSNETGHLVYSLKAHDDCFKLKLAFWSNGMVYKVVPCILLTISIVALLKIIADVSHRRKSLCQVMKKKVPHDHTTPMLVAVLSIFLVAELPQGMMLVLTGVFSSETFHQKFYVSLGDFMDLLSLLNSAVNFVIYCVMSRKFRSVFFKLFLGCWKEFDDFDDLQTPNERTDVSQRRFSSAVTNNTRTEQLSHYPSTASTLNVSTYERRTHGNLLSVDDATSRRSSACTLGVGNPHSPTLNAPFTFEDGTATPAPSNTKRISFNLATDSHGGITACTLQVPVLPAKNSVIKSPQVGFIARLRQRLPPIRRLGRYLWPTDNTLLTDDVNSPQRRFNSITTETNFVAMAY
uniref:G_PROTEIN_RECEP_F1_2 domain-containing protein n=1 Tax=Panagrellus redivivus TaxID=6233 RepID=A0A7E4VHE1_PANRE